MLPLLAVVCLAWPAAATLPDVTVSHSDGHLQFKMPHLPGAKQVFINYVLHTVEDKVLPKVGKAVLGGDGQWLWRDLQHVLQPGDKLEYDVTVYGQDGKLHGPTQHWQYAPAASLGPRRMRAVVFRDDFNRVSTQDWNYEISMYGGMNWEFQVYADEDYNVFTRNGVLYLKPTLTTDDPRWNNDFLYHGVMDVNQIWGTCTQSANDGCHREGRNGLLPPVMSGKLWSKPTLRFGRVEVRARIPRGDWIWPAIWLLPQDSEYGSWPRSGEIDIMESRGNMDHGVTETLSTLHWGKIWSENQFQRTSGVKEKTGGGNWATDFHVWKLEWTPDHLVTFIDDQEVLRVDPGAGGFCAFGQITDGCPWEGRPKMAPFDKDFYMILNVAVGGTNGFFPDGLWPNKPWRNDSPDPPKDFWEAKDDWYRTWHGDNVAMLVDYVQFESL